MNLNLKLALMKSLWFFSGMLVNANSSTIKEINLDDPDHFMASENVFNVAAEGGWVICCGPNMMKSFN